MKSREEIIDGITARFHGEMDGVWKNGYFHGVEDGKEDVKNKLEVIDEIKLGEYFKGYHDGLKEAWDAARRIREMLNTDWINVFGPQTCDPIDDLTAEDAIIKLKEWDDRAAAPSKTVALCAGMEVIDRSGNRCVILNTEKAIHVLYPNGKTHKWKKSDRLEPTGRFYSSVTDMILRIK